MFTTPEVESSTPQANTPVARGKVKDRIYAELEGIRAQHGGMLSPEDVVEFARSPNTELHRHFEWDDGEAAARYRLQQASEIIRVVVVIEPRSQAETRAYVNLTSDRHSYQPGYRAVVDVLGDKQLRAQLVEDAKNELSAFATKYRRLRKLAAMRGVFKAIDKLVGAKG